MPFDIVWIENSKFTGSDEDKTLGLKNLIGRAGRSTLAKSQFDYGFVVVKNDKKFIERFNGPFLLSNELAQALQEVQLQSPEWGDGVEHFDRKGHDLTF